MKPFEDDSAVRTIGDLAIENGTDRIAVHGTTDIERTSAGLAKAEALAELFKDIVEALRNGPLLDAPPADAPIGSMPNPFGTSKTK